MLLNKDRRAEALAELEGQDAEKERERALTENARRRQAAMGIFLCLLELKRPVEAAEAAGVRLDMCEIEEERRQVIQPTAAGFGRSHRSRSVCLCRRQLTSFQAVGLRAVLRTKLVVFITTYVLWYTHHATRNTKA